MLHPHSPLWSVAVTFPLTAQVYRFLPFQNENSPGRAPWARHPQPLSGPVSQLPWVSAPSSRTPASCACPSTVGELSPWKLASPHLSLADRVWHSVNNLWKQRGGRGTTATRFLGPLLGPRLPLCPHLAEGSRELSGVSFKGTNPIHKGSTLMSTSQRSHLLK